MAEFSEPLRSFVFEHNDLPDGWQWVSVQVLDHKGREPKDWRFDQYEGAVYPHLITRGPRKGEPNYRKPEPGTQRVVVTDRAAFIAWLPAWEARTGNCGRCAGEGNVFAGSSEDGGIQTKPCPKCGGTGRPAARTETGTDETLQAAQPERQEPEMPAQTPPPSREPFVVKTLGK